MISEESRKKYSEASKRRQAAIPPEVRKAWMIRAAKMRWATKSVAQRRAHALKMVKARKKATRENAEITQKNNLNISQPQ